MTNESPSPTAPLNTSKIIVIQETKGKSQQVGSQIKGKGKAEKEIPP